MRHAFSLVELSIVLVILGLLTGGILVGRSIVHASEVRSVTSDYGRFMTGITNFRDKYAALPGDMPDAVKYWGAQAGATTNGIDATCAALVVAATGTETCNGDGDGYISGINFIAPHESYRAWQQLANAGMISGKFTGVSSGGVCCSNPATGENIPASKLPQVGYHFRAYPPQVAASATYFAGDYGSIMWIGIPLAASGSLRTASIKPEDAWNIDSKIDDGKPGFGAWVAPEVLSTCHTNSDPALSEYALGYSSIACAFMVKMGV